MSSTSEVDPAFATARVAAGALFVDENERVLLVRPTYKTYWDLPGGYLEPGETPRGACIREVQEELGISPNIGKLLSVDWAPHPAEGDKILFIFDGGTLSAETLSRIRFADGELDSFAFVSAPQLRELTVERLSRRIEGTLVARRAAVPAYLEDGLEPLIQ